MLADYLTSLQAGDIASAPHGGCQGPQRTESGGVSSLWHAYIWHDSSWGRAWGKYSCSRGKSAVGTKLAPVKSVFAGSSWALSVTMSASAIFLKIITHNAPPSNIALVEAEDIHLCNNVMHNFMHQVLMGGKMGKLLLCMLTGIGRS